MIPLLGRPGLRPPWLATGGAGSAGGLLERAERLLGDANNGKPGREIDPAEEAALQPIVTGHDAVKPGGHVDKVSAGAAGFQMLRAVARRHSHRLSAVPQ